MKKIIYFASAALCLSISDKSLSLPATAKTYYWFKAKNNYLVGTLPSGIQDADVTYVATGGTAPLSPCTYGYYYDCLLGFTVLQVTTNGQHLGTSLAGKTPRTAAYSRD